MTRQEIKDFCCNSSKVYYKYLENKKESRSEIKVISIDVVDQEEDTLKLKLSKGIIDLDGIIFQIIPSLHEYDTEKIRIIEYDHDSNVIIIQPCKELKSEICGLKPDQLKIIYDLKFLVKRVHDWYEVNGIKLQLPSAVSVLTSTYKEIIYFKNRIPDSNQEEAIQNIFTNPFSYIWGAPGTGKTQFVLAYSIIHYVKAGKKVAIFAPTNNAIEQVLSGVLKMTAQAEIQYNQIIRLGNPSKKFSEKYPEICEVKGLMKRIAVIDKKIKIINNIIVNESKRQNVKKIEDIIPLFDQLDGFQSNRNNLFKELSTAERSLKNEENKFDLKQTEINTIKREITNLEKKINSLSHSFKKIFNSSPSIEELTLQEKQKLLKRHLTENDLVHKEILRFKKNVKKLKEDYDDITPSVKLFEQIKYVSSIEQEVAKITSKINLDNYNIIKLLLNNIVGKLKTEISVSQSLATNYSNLSSAELLAQLQELGQRKDYLEKLTTKERIKEVNIIATTLDCYIGRYINEDLPIDHIFLDEASYACAIKALTVFRRNIPITFLGDHKQLPPVCMLNDDEIANKGEYNNVFVWSQSSIFLEGVFNKTKEQLFADYLSSLKAIESQHTFSYTKKTELKVTHRFGLNLAQVLNTFVYKNGFTSKSDDGETQIYILNVPHFYPQPSVENNGRTKALRRNIYEARMIRELIQKFSHKEYAILTPYTDQVRQLEELLPNERDESKIMTVHGSQGQEWKDVIFSVVDTDKKYFVDSLNKNSRGLNLINTAVSRANKSLFLVCNVNYWMKQNNQLIKGIIDTGELIKL